MENINPKHEIRISKQIRMTKKGNSKLFMFWKLENSDLGFVSCFEIRISNFIIERRV
jgi:hypothetical protein